MGNYILILAPEALSVYAKTYASQLYKRWGLGVFKKFFHMYNLHRTPLETLLINLLTVLDEHDGRFTFPTVASVAAMHQDEIRSIVREGHEIASHGYNHLRYPKISKRKREHDLASSLSTYKKMRVPITGFRAPYNSYTEDLPQLLDKYKLSWDGGYGRSPEYRERKHFFTILNGNKESRVLFIPLNFWTDDRMIDKMKMKKNSVTERLKTEITKRAETGGVIMFDLHPIRIGQPAFVDCIGEALDFANSLGAWSTTPTEAIKYWRTHKKWKGDASFCLLLTGDIDCWTFSDYLRRIDWTKPS